MTRPSGPGASGRCTSRSPSAWRRVTRGRPAWCSGPGWRPSHWRATGWVACRAARSWCDWQVAEEPSFRRVVRGAATPSRTRPGPQRARRGGRVGPRTRVLLPVPGRGPAVAGRPDAHGSGARGRWPRDHDSRSRRARNYEEGCFTAYRRLAEEQPDLVLHLGDYLYEGRRSVGTRAARPRPRGRRDADPRRLPAAARAVQDRSRPPARTRGRALGGGLRRPRGGCQLGRVPPARLPSPASRGVARRRSAPTTSTCRCAAPHSRTARTCRSSDGSRGATWPRCTCWTPGSTATTRSAATPA